MATRIAACILIVFGGLAALLWPAVCASQSVRDADDIGRLRFDYQRSVSERMRAFSVTSYEQFLGSDELPGTREKLTLTGGVSYNAKDWLRLEGGVGLYYSWRDPATDLFELRLWQAATFDWPEVQALAQWAVHHRFMLEERFQQSGDWDTSLRGRYRLSFTVPINRYTVQPGALYMPVEGELFWNPGDGSAELFANRATVTAGLGYQFNKGWAVEVRYVWQESRRAINTDFSRDDNIIELRVKSTTRILDYLKSR
jgi:hypothetical protein